MSTEQKVWQRVWPNYNHSLLWCIIRKAAVRIQGISLHLPFPHQVLNLWQDREEEEGEMETEGLLGPKQRNWLNREPWWHSPGHPPNPVPGSVS